MMTPNQEVSKAAPEAITNAQGPTAAGNANCPGTPKLLDCSLMTGEELDAFVTLSTCSGASAEIAVLAEIKAGFSARSGRGNALGGPQGAAPEITIMGANTRKAVIWEVDQLV